MYRRIVKVDNGKGQGARFPMNPRCVESHIYGTLSLDIFVLWRVSRDAVSSWKKRERGKERADGKERGVGARRARSSRVMEHVGVGYLAAPATKSRDITGIVLTISRNTHHRHDTTPCQNIPRSSGLVTVDFRLLFVADDHRCSGTTVSNCTPASFGHS